MDSKKKEKKTIKIIIIKANTKSKSNIWLILWKLFLFLYGFFSIVVSVFNFNSLFFFSNKKRPIFSLKFRNVFDKNSILSFPYCCTVLFWGVESYHKNSIYVQKEQYFFRCTFFPLKKNIISKQKWDKTLNISRYNLKVTATFPRETR